MHTTTYTEDPAYRAALQAAVLPCPAHNSDALWSDATLLAHADRIGRVTARHLREALLLQEAIVAEVCSDPRWRGNLRRALDGQRATADAKQAAA